MKRGEIFWFDFGEALGSEAEGRRLGVVVSCDALNSSVETVVVLPTSASGIERKRKFNRNILLSLKEIPGLPKDCVAQAHLVRHMSRQRLLQQDAVAEVTPEVMYEVSVALGRSLDAVNPIEDGG